MSPDYLGFLIRNYFAASESTSMLDTHVFYILELLISLCGVEKDKRK